MGRGSSGVARGVLTLAVFCATLALGIPGAHAAITYQTEWGEQGSEPGQFDTPEGIGTSASGDVYVADTTNDRVQRFTSDGLFLNAWGTFGLADGRFNRPGGIAVDFAGNV